MKILKTINLFGESFDVDAYVNGTIKRYFENWEDFKTANNDKILTVKSGKVGVSGTTLTTAMQQATKNLFGRVKLSDSTGDTSLDASKGVAVTPKALSDATSGATTLRLVHAKTSGNYNNTMQIERKNSSGTWVVLGDTADIISAIGLTKVENTNGNTLQVSINGLSNSIALVDGVGIGHPTGTNKQNKAIITVNGVSVADANSLNIIDNDSTSLDHKDTNNADSANVLRMLINHDVVKRTTIIDSNDASTILGIKDVDSNKHLYVKINGVEKSTPLSNLISNVTVSGAVAPSGSTARSNTIKVDVNGTNSSATIVSDCSVTIQDTSTTNKRKQIKITVNGVDSSFVDLPDFAMSRTNNTLSATVNGITKTATVVEGSSAMVVSSGTYKNKLELTLNGVKITSDEIVNKIELSGATTQSDGTATNDIGIKINGLSGGSVHSVARFAMTNWTLDAGKTDSGTLKAVVNNVGLRDEGSATQTDGLKCSLKMGDDGVLTLTIGPMVLKCKIYATTAKYASFLVPFADLSASTFKDDSQWQKIGGGYPNGTFTKGTQTFDGDLISNSLILS